MPIRKVLQYPQDEALLRRKSIPLPKVDKQVRALIRDLEDTLLRLGGAGLAAPQIGVHARVVVVRFGQNEGAMQPPTALINPTIISEGITQEGFDGCLSLPHLATWKTYRPATLTFTALDERGQPLRMDVSDIDARAVHHEIDHLNGILFVDRLQKISDLYRITRTAEGESLAKLDLQDPLRLVLQQRNGLS